jgi:hypothetical protein
MMMLQISAMGPDPRGLFAQVAASAPFRSRLPLDITVNHEEISFDEDWAREALRRGDDLSVSADWLGLHGERYTGPWLKLDPWGLVSWKIEGEEVPTLDSVFAFVSGLPFEILVIGPLFEDRRSNAPPGEWDGNREPLDGLSEGHRVHGLGVLFRGKGHERLVSRRWLDHGPWIVRRMEHDTTWIQFHDADADAETAWAQAARAHDRMGISHVGGYLQHDYVFHSTIGGLYKAADRSLTIVRSGEPLTQVELLDVCAYRAQMRTVAKQPIDRVRVLFMEERDARRYLHELWLRELECWCIDAQGREVRLDDGYQPERIVPEWVERVEGRAARVAPPQVQLSLGLANLLADPEGDLPGDWNRDELLFHILDWMGQETRPAGYEVREVLGAHLSRLVKKAGETGDLVVRAFDDIGGAMADDRAVPLLARARAVRPQVELPFDPERLGLSLPAIIVPDPYPRQQPIKFGQGHPLDGVIVHQVSDVLARVRSLNREDLRDAEALLRLCADDRFVLSATSRVTATPEPSVTWGGAASALRGSDTQVSHPDTPL